MHSWRQLHWSCIALTLEMRAPGETMHCLPETIKTCTHLPNEQTLYTRIPGCEQSWAPKGTQVL